jgi:3',5'-nucleoside bisphosphate phosphatase
VNRFADLHLHTIHSDGRRTPSEVVQRAAAARLDIISISDHDHLAGYEDALPVASELGITLVTGVELSVAWRGFDLHLLAWAFDPTSATLGHRLEQARTARERRGEQMVRKLAELGLPVTLEQVQKIQGGGSMGRPHIGQALIDIGACSSMRDAFDRYLSPGCPGFVPKEVLSLEEALGMIHDAGGVTAVAHPTVYPRHELVVPELLELGVDGVEILHPDVTPEWMRHYGRLCTGMGKMRTGGSDDHGFPERQKLGTIRVPESWIVPIMERIEHPV